MRLTLLLATTALGLIAIDSPAHAQLPPGPTCLLSAACTWTAPQTFKSGISTTTLLGQITTTGNATGSWNFVLSESYPATPGTFVTPFNIQDTMTSGGTGERQVLTVNEITGYGVNGQFYVAGQFAGYVCGTTSTGQCTGQAGGGGGAMNVLDAYVLVYPGASSSVQAVSFEADTDIRGPVSRKAAIQVVDKGTSTNSGSSLDAAILIGTQSPGIGYNNGLQFGEVTSGSFAVNSTGTLIVTSIGAANAKYNYGSFIDFHNSTCTNYQFYGANGGNFSIDCSGAIDGSTTHPIAFNPSTSHNMLIAPWGQNNAYTALSFNGTIAGGAMTGFIASATGADTLRAVAQGNIFFRPGADATDDFTWTTTGFSTALTTASTSTTTGAIIDAGGLGVAGAAYIGGAIVGSGTITATLANAATTSSVCYNTGTGLFTYDSTIGTCNTSSEQFKHDIDAIAFDPLLGVMRMAPVTFEYDASMATPGEQLGFIAEQLEAIDPLLVGYDDQGKPNSIRFLGPMFAYVVGAEQEMQGEIEALQTKIRQLENR